MCVEPKSAIPNGKVAQQLLAACVVAQYVAQHDKELATDDDRINIYKQQAGFTDTPTVVQGGHRYDDCGIVGTTDYGVVVAFRGTLEDMSDWIKNDLDGKEVSLPEFSQGRVHHGFYESITILWDKKCSYAQHDRKVEKGKTNSNLPDTFVKREILKRLSKRGTKKAIYITGHSKGGAMATLASWYMFEAEEPLIKEAAKQTYTFASPRCGDQEFVDNYNKHVEQFTFENERDVVPLVPFRPIGIIGWPIHFFSKLVHSITMWQKTETIFPLVPPPTQVEFRPAGTRFIYSEKENPEGEVLRVEKGKYQKEKDRSNFWSNTWAALLSPFSKKVGPATVLLAEHNKECICVGSSLDDENDNQKECYGTYQKMLLMAPFNGADEGFSDRVSKKLCGE